ncbi:DNA polymerase domain-containing protein [Aneurinibacillus sp. Ricciae_BoGa-3]|uniref:DNA polymerase domain-containing protein n=1 Tax=Aneurinibacillus sp. Ricciae_BoGa-3 TaxID=3022697 RepID=UPI00234168A9|nr:DNA polymerase domain-containing protein [Aneurinibacillus sp. Ricciae_BoGa-3]WCK53806.1 DNA polymerase domain-containing protein [Aneurinibacillus sp. Ricciae_BoGa-3]
MDSTIQKEQRLTKTEYTRYLHFIAPFLLPYTRDRMAMWFSYPQGLTGKRVERRSIRAEERAPEWLATITYKGKTRVLLNDRETLLWVASGNIKELHVPFDKVNCPGYPTELILDIDGDGNRFEQVCEVALAVKEVLDKLQLRSVAKTSGKSGLHIHVPLAECTYTFEQVRPINKFIADFLVEKMSQLVTIERVKDKRENKIYFDWMQLWAGRTLAVPYSVRATKQATVATPVTWEEVQHGIDPTDFTIFSMPNRIKDKGDLFAPLTTEKAGQTLDEILAFLSSK